MFKENLLYNNLHLGGSGSQGSICHELSYRWEYNVPLIVAELKNKFEDGLKQYYVYLRDSNFVCLYDVEKIDDDKIYGQFPGGIAVVKSFEFYKLWWSAIFYCSKPDIEELSKINEATLPINAEETKTYGEYKGHIEFTLWWLKGPAVKHYTPVFTVNTLDEVLKEAYSRYKDNDEYRLSLGFLERQLREHKARWNQYHNVESEENKIDLKLVIEWMAKYGWEYVQESELFVKYETTKRVFPRKIYVYHMVHKLKNMGKPVEEVLAENTVEQILGYVKGE
jgi:hypothetical protein